MFNLNWKIKISFWYFEKECLKVFSFHEAGLLERKTRIHFKFSILMQHLVYNLIAVKKLFIRNSKLKEHLA